MLTFKSHCSIYSPDEIDQYEISWHDHHDITIIVAMSMLLQKRTICVNRSTLNLSGVGNTIRRPELLGELSLFCEDSAEFVASRFIESCKHIHNHNQITNSHGLSIKV